MTKKVPCPLCKEKVLPRGMFFHLTRNAKHKGVNVGPAYNKFCDSMGWARKRKRGPGRPLGKRNSGPRMPRPQVSHRKPKPKAQPEVEAIDLRFCCHCGNRLPNAVVE